MSQMWFVIFMVISAIIFTAEAEIKERRHHGK